MSKTLTKLIFCILWFPLLVFGQEQQRLFVDRFTQEDGLLQLNTDALTQDHLGYVWAGTEDGLHRFNGYGFKPFVLHAKDSTGIADDHIRGLLAVNDTLWIASASKGILGYRLSKNKFFQLYDKPAEHELNIGHSIFKLNDGFLMLSVDDYGILFNQKTKAYQFIKLPKANATNYITAVVSYKKDNYLVGTKETGLLNFNLKTKTFSTTAEVSETNINDLVMLGETVLAGSNNGLFSFHLKTKLFSKLPFDYKPYRLHDLGNNKLYIATANGLFLYNVNNNTTISIELTNRLNNTAINTTVEHIISDDRGNTWFGTNGDGLLYTNKFQRKFLSEKIQLNTEDEHINVFPIYKQNDTTLWFGTTKGTVRHNPKTGQYKQYPTAKDGITYEFLEDENGTLWAGTIFDGLLKYQPETDRFKQWKKDTTANGLPDNEISSLIPIDRNTIWATTWAGGIVELNTKTERFLPVLLSGRQLNRARAYLHDSKGHLWLGTDEGLFKIDVENRSIIHRYTQESNDQAQLTGNRIFAIKEDPLGNLWIGTSSGLTKLDFNTNQTTLYYKQEGFPNDFVYTILLDKNNRIWLSTNYGISVFNPDKGTFKNYTQADGLQNNEFNGKSAFKDEAGNFYFGGINGYNVFNPLQVTDNPYFPKVHIESVELFNKPIERNEMFADTLYFKSEENILTFNFTALNYLNPQKCLYQYKLSGFDEHWSPPSVKKSVTYTNLDPKTYRLKIRATNDAGVWNYDQKELTVVIIPPWYKTLWAKIGFGLLAIAMAVLFYFYKTSRLKQDKLKLEALVKARTQDLRAKNEALKASNKTTEQQRDNIQFLMKELSHRVKNNLQIVSSLLNIQGNLIKNKETKDILTVAKNRILAISFVQEELNNKVETNDIGRFVQNFSTRLIELLSDEEKPKFGTQFDIEYNIDSNLNITLIGLILNELITNTYKYAFSKYGEGNLLCISVKKENDFIYLTIKDNGKGYNKNAIKATSLGLEMIAEMVTQLNGKLTTHTHNGVNNTIKIPAPNPKCK